MTSSSKGPTERGLDTMLVVYSLLQGHPASLACEQFIRNHTGWFTSTINLFEVKAILTKVYSVTGALATQKLAQFADGPIVVTDVDEAMALAAMNTADGLGLDLPDAVLLQTARARGAAWLATDDSKLAQACSAFGLLAQSPVDAGLRQLIATWESANLATKGLPRILRQVHHWLSQTHPQAAQDFWSHSGGASHLP